MFLSLVRPDRISSPMTRMAAVTIEVMAFPFRVTRYTASRNCHGKRLMNDDAQPAAPRRPIAFAAAQVTRSTDPDGTIRLASPDALGAYDPSLARLFRSAVAAQPARIFLQERAGNGWRSLTYAQARRSVDAVAAALMSRGLSAERPVMILSGN